jgi:hypothetical protein
VRRGGEVHYGVWEQRRAERERKLTVPCVKDECELML